MRCSGDLAANIWSMMDMRRPLVRNRSDIVPMLRLCESVSSFNWLLNDSIRLIPNAIRAVSTSKRSPKLSISRYCDRDFGRFMGMLVSFFIN